MIDLKARAAARLQRTRRRVRMPRVRQPNAPRLAYSRGLLAMQAEANALVEKKLGPMLPDLVAEAGLVHDATVPRDYPEKIQRAIAQVAEEFFGRFPQDRLRAFAIGMGLRSSEAQKKDLRAQMVAIFGQSVSIDVFTEKGIPARLSAWASANAQLITTIPSRYFEEIATRTVQALRDGERAEDLQQVIRDRYGVSQSRARLIARDQLGKLYGELTKARQENLGISSFVWRTSEDERVREEHVALDGLQFPWNAPPSEGIPGEPINCRCTGEPVVSEALEEAAAGGGGSEPPPPEKPSPPAAESAPWEPKDFAGEYAHLGDAAQPVSVGRAALENGLDATAGEVSLEAWPAPLRKNLGQSAQFIVREGEQGKTLREVIERIQAEAAQSPEGSTERKIADANAGTMKAIAAVHGHIQTVAQKGGGFAPPVKFQGGSSSPLRDGIENDFESFMRAMFRPNERLRAGLEQEGVPVKWLPPWGRGYFDPRKIEIALAPTDKTRDRFTLGHEFGHLLEETSSSRGSNAQAFLAARTKGDPRVTMRQATGNVAYGPEEVTRPDKFIDPYVGKDYGVLNASEVTSMGVEYLFHSPATLMRKDPEHFFFTLGQLAAG